MNELNQIVEPLLCWYDEERRILPWREDPLPYHVWISEIMLQQTRVEAVIDYYHRFLKRFPDVITLAEAELDEVLRYWQGLGYYRRCEMLHKAAKEIVAKYEGQLPADFDRLLALPGIGRYTAAAVMSIGFEIPYPAVDGNVLRVIMRVTDRYDCIDEESTKRAVEKELAEVIPAERASAFTQALMDLGATVCLPNGEP
ncbi:MAG: A/G-specific adenine glycosylase, partial [Firmicutes bacterium]|nr:A/G-specific adenine glycosylase [Bacillota bacterium]